MIDHSEIIAKIKKCLALSASSNEHEAAAALRQAQKLMELHGISEQDVALSDVGEESTRAGATKSPATWESGLACLVGEAFGCPAIFRSEFFKGGRWVFVGFHPAPEIARYAFEVLYRQAKRARSTYIRTALKRCSKNKTRRADLFSEGWVIAATAKLVNLVPSARQREVLSSYVEKNFNLQPLKARDRNAGRNLTERECDDAAAGRRSGRSAELNHGVGGQAAPLALR